MRWRTAASYVAGSVAFTAFVGLGAFTIVSLTPRGGGIEPPTSSFLIDQAQPLLPSVPERSEPARASIPRSVEAGSAEPFDEPPPGPRVAPPPLPSRGAGEASSVRRETAMLSAPPAPARDQVLPAPERAALPRPLPDKPRAAPVPKGPPVLTPADIRQIKHSLRLTPEQAVHWPPVEVVLNEISAQQVTLVRAGQDASGAFDSGTSMRVYFAVQPLLGTLREDQKALIRARARAMGFGQVASYL